MMISIRSIKNKEWKDLQSLNNEVFIDNHKYDLDLVLDWAYSKPGEKYFKELVNDEDSVCIVAAENDGKLVGYLAASPKPISYRKSKYIEIDNMGVIPEYRSKGIGKMLIDKCVEFAKIKGCNKVLVNSYYNNTGAIKFYKNNGFLPIDISLEKQI